MRGGLNFEDKGVEEGDPPLCFVGRGERNSPLGLTLTRICHVGLYPCGKACMSH